MATATTHYQDALIVLGAAGLVVPLLRRLGINSILGFLLVSICLSPGLLGRAAVQIPLLDIFLITNPDEISAFAEYGVVFLMFLIGLEISPQRLLTMKQLVFGLGGLQILISATILTMLLHLLGYADREALILALALSLSSTAIVIQLFADDKRLNSGAGQLSFAVLLMQDLAVIPILLLLKVSSTGSNNFIATDLAIFLVQAFWLSPPLWFSASSPCNHSCVWWQAQKVPTSLWPRFCLSQSAQVHWQQVRACPCHLVLLLVA